MNKIVLFIIAIVLIPVTLYIFYKRSMPESDIKTENGFVIGDNIIVIDGMDKERARDMVVQIGKMYPADMSSRWEGNHFIISYTRGIKFTTFCFVVNYLVYPFDMVNDKRLKVKAWCRTSGIDWGGSNELMLYVPDRDTEYDNVYISTKDGRYFKQMFAHPEPCVAVRDLFLRYEERKVKF